MRKLFAFVAIFLVCISAVRVALQVNEPIDLENVLEYCSRAFGDTNDIKAVFDKFAQLEQKFSFYNDGEKHLQTYAGPGGNIDEGTQGGGGTLEVNRPWYEDITHFFKNFFNDIVVCFQYLLTLIELLWAFIEMIIKDITAIFKVLSYLCFGLPI